MTVARIALAADPGHLTMADDDLTRFGVGLLQLLDAAATNSTYKYALLVALIDSATESVGARGGPRGSVTTEVLARRVIGLYWPQSRAWHDADGGSRVLKALGSRGASFVDRIVDARAGLPARTTPRELELAHPDRWGGLLDGVEETLIRYPIPLLQRVGGDDVVLLYEPSPWPEQGAGLRLAAHFAARRAGSATSEFDNRVVFLPGAEESLARLAPLLRPLVMERWARWTERANRLTGERTLYDFLFGADRISLAPVRDGIRALQDGACFYCGEPLGGACHVDHFVPWARVGCDDLFNLVAAHARCNSSKRDHLAARRHVERWADRLDRRADDLSELGEKVDWAADGEHARRIAVSAYALAGDFTRLWIQGGEFEAFDADLVEVMA